MADVEMGNHMSDKATGLNYIFLFSNVPTPWMLQMVRGAVSEGFKTALIYLERSKKPVKAETIDGCEVITRPVSFKRVGISRFIEVFRLCGWLREFVTFNAVRGVRLQTDSVDLLALAEITLSGKGALFYHQVRDLHTLQLGKGPFCGLVRLVDRILLSRVSMLVLTCERYYKEYYKHYYRGVYSVVENWPDYSAWRGFRKKQSDDFVVGYIGVVRYLDCLKALIAAIDILRSEGAYIRLKICGGGESQALLREVGDRRWIDCQGTFSYRDEVKKIYSNVNLIWAVYDIRYKNVRFAMPNKFYESILSGIPILVAEGTYLEERVRTMGIGSSVPGLDPYSIAEKLREAYAGRGWYLASQEKLNAIAKSDFIRNELALKHQKAIRTALLGSR